MCGETRHTDRVRNKRCVGTLKRGGEKETVYEQEEKRDNRIYSCATRENREIKCEAIQRHRRVIWESSQGKRDLLEDYSNNVTRYSLAARPDEGTDITVKLWTMVGHGLFLSGLRSAWRLSRPNFL
jgi:hypothetical protein